MTLVPRLALALSSLLVALLVVVGLAPATASAHSGKQSYLFVSFFGDGIEGRAEIPVGDLGPVLGIDFPDAPGGLDNAVDAYSAEIEAYVAEHTGLGTATENWELDYGTTSILATENGPYVVLDFVVDEDIDNVPRSFVASFSVIIESDPERDALLVIQDDWSGAIFNNEERPLLGFSVGMTEQTVVLEDASTLSSVAAVRGIGTNEFRAGIDLLLLVAAATATMILVPFRRNESTPRPLSTVGRSAAACTGIFVLAFTITLWVVGLGVVALPTRATAAIIAGALALQAVYLTAARFRPSARRLATAVFALAGGALGLGLGAAFVLRELDRSRPMTGLVAFQVGVLVAALLVALFVGAPLLLLRRTRYAAALVGVLSAVFLGSAIALLSALPANDDRLIREIAKPLRVWLRNTWFVLLAVAAAGAVRTIEQRAGRLRSSDVQTSPAPESFDAPSEMASP